MTQKTTDSSESTLRFLSHVGRTLGSSLDFAAVSQSAAKLAVPALADLCTIELVDGHGVVQLQALAAAAPLHDAFTGARADTAFTIRDESALARAILAGTTIALAGDALAIDNARLYAREHRVADTLQRAMLPEKLPFLAGQEFHAAYLPRTEAKVGGDWYDAFPISEGVIALSIGDVAGHGLEAAVVMGEVRQAFRAAALDAKDPASVLDRADRILKFRENPTMVTAIFGIYNAATATFTYATAGHPPPILATPDGPVQILPSDGLPLGIRRDERSTNWTVSIPPGSLLTLYTDGLIEYGRDVIAGEDAHRGHSKRSCIALERSRQRVATAHSWRSAPHGRCLHPHARGHRTSGARTQSHLHRHSDRRAACAPRGAPDDQRSRPG